MGSDNPTIADCLRKPPLGRRRDETWTDEDVIAWAIKLGEIDNPHLDQRAYYQEHLGHLRLEIHIRLCCPEVYDQKNDLRKRVRNGS